MSETPVIFIPGILGSQLYSAEDEKKLWFSAPAILSDAAQLDIQNDVIVKNTTVDQQTMNPLQREYGVVKQDVIIIEWLCRTMPETPVYFFSYDFRKSCAKAADQLHQVIKEIGAEKVHIICHSMGGLVTAAYVSRYGIDTLSKVFMLGVPFEGSYEVIRMYLTGDVREIPNAVAETVGITREMLIRYPGLAELIPTLSHLKAHPIETYGVPMTEEEMETVVSDLIPETYAAARAFQDSIQSGISRLLEKPDCYFGIGYGKTTLQSLSLTENQADPVRVDSESGDGLVPCFSSTIRGTLLRFLEEKNPRIQAFSVQHANLVRVPEVLKWISECFKL